MGKEEEILLKKVKNLLLANLGTILIFVAVLGLDSKTPFMVYEPDIPDCLKR